MKGMTHKLPYLVLAVLTILATFDVPVWAHQPVMDMAPRWKGGYGFQVREEYRSSDTVLDGDNKIDNPLGRDRRVSKTWLEGIYTFKREVRATFKVPWVDQKRTAIKDGVAVRQEGSGLGDLVIGMPLKKYANFSGGTYNFGFTPSVRFATGSTSGDFPAGDGSTDVNLSLSYSHEQAALYQFYNVWYWINNGGKKGIDEGDELGLDANIGLHPYHNNRNNSGVFVMVEGRVRHKERGIDLGGTTGGTRLSLAPVLVLYREGVMFRAEYHFPVYERQSGTQVSYGQELNIGIGITF